MILFTLVLTSFSAALLLSFLKRVYVSLLVDLGSTFNKTLSTGMVRVFGIAGYLNDHDGPCGWRKLTFTALSSSFTWITHATHHFSSRMHTTKPLISSSASSLSKN